MRLFTLDWPQFVVLVLGLCAILVIMTIMLMRNIGDALIRLDLKRYEREFGFEMGLVPGYPSGQPHDGWWGIASITPGGWMERAGVRSGDVVFDRHGSGLATLLWAIEQAAAGQTACFVVIGAEDRRRHDRDVCLEGRPGAKSAAVIDAPGPGVCQREGYALAREEPRRIDGKMPAPTRLHYTAPKYPALPKATVGSGSWTGEVLIDRSGTIRHLWPIREVQFTPPFPAFKASIVDAIRQWQYEPSWFAGQPVFVCMTVTVTVDWR
jgi:hypothetical protein